jgi:hypothetical protein
MSFGGTGGGQQQSLCPPTPYKRWENRNYCHTHGGDVDNAHTSAACGKPGPTHNPNTNCANIMGRLVAEMHNTILPSACGRTPPNCCPQQQQQHPQQCTLIAYFPSGGTAWQQPTLPAQFSGMPPTSCTYHQQTTMAMPVYQPLPSKCQKCANADGGANDDEPLCPQPAAQPAALVLLTSRGR